MLFHYPDFVIGDEFLTHSDNGEIQLLRLDQVGDRAQKFRLDSNVARQVFSVDTVVRVLLSMIPKTSRVRSYPRARNRRRAQSRRR